MNKEKNLEILRDNLQSLQSHLNKLLNNKYKLHQIDIDLMRDKILDAYEVLNDLGLALEKEKTDHQKIINLPEKTPKAEIPQQASETVVEEEVLQEEKTNYDQSDADTIKTIDPKLDDSQVKRPVSNEKITADVPVVENASKLELKKENDNREVKIEQESEKPKTYHTDSLPKQAEKSTVDLFSESAEKTIADKLGSTDESSIADKLQQSQVNDLREVIGINEKFLFINELFNGDLGRYNKAIDELNELTSQQGINAYLIELKIANRWNDENEAYIKLYKLLERKIS